MGIQSTELRKMRKGQLMELVDTSGGIEYLKLTGLFSLRTGLRTKTIGEMIKELVDAEVFVIRDGIVMTTKRAEVEAKELEKGAKTNETSKAKS